MVKKSLLTASLVILSLTTIISCSKTEKDNASAICDTIPKNFTVDVNPIIQTFCNQAACHDPGSSNGPGPLTNYNEIFAAKNEIRGQVKAGLMPQNTTLSKAQKNIIICWIDNGAPNN